ncbi:stimulated by retinoic acid gene 6 protein-like [Saccoglossus kowalevskii]|uniref:Receptor for retinol uptake STRA6 n=1 Tax=Saccoglossus kowalevskii TaxID=10224 RepID=A0ABM0GJ94_SACKO|nr:PREDICTED: stimulated by retinoic acid gene 6 protein homolog [Saccoglossus kowalevskii]
MELVDNVTISTTDVNGTAVEVLTCIPIMNSGNFFMWSLIPAGITVFVLIFLQSRTHLCKGCLGGRPGLIYPVNLLDSRSHRVSYVAAFGVASTACFNIFNGMYPFPIEGPNYVKVFWSILAVFVYGLSYYPIFVCIAMESIVSYLIGTLYSCGWCFVVITGFIQCTSAENMTPAHFDIIFDLPLTLCSVYLAIRFPVLLIKSIVDAVKTKTHRLTLKEKLSKNYQAVYVKHVFKKKNTSEMKGHSSEEKTFLKCIKVCCQKICYQSVPGFRYSPRIICALVVGTIVIYKIYALCAGPYSLYIDTLYDFIAGTGPYIEILGFNSTETIGVIQYYIRVGKVCYFVGLSTSFGMSLVIIFLIFVNYRENVLNLYKGRSNFIPEIESISNDSKVVSCVRYAGFQVGYLIWGFIVQAILFGLLSLGLAYLVFIPLIDGYGKFILDFAMSIWPAIVIGFALTILQRLLARFVFLQDNGRTFALNNRRLFHNFSYLMFFFNMFLGLFSCLMRIVKAIILGTALLSRIDSSTLSKKFERFDPGFMAYVGFLHVETAHTNPIMVTFCHILIHLNNERKQLESTYNSQQLDDFGMKGSTANNLRRRRIARNRWFLAYTLQRNPVMAVKRQLLFKRDYVNEALDAGEEALAIAGISLLN